jgi:DHA2 family multidrug resistance protein
LIQAQATVYAMVQKQASMLAFIDVFWAMGALFLVMVPLVLLMRKPEAGGGPPPAH